MCGFVGYFKPKELNFNLDLKQSSNSIIHRGPDMQNNVISETYNIFFNRLSINDLSDNGQQPFTFDDNTVFANGEIYNHKKIRDDHKDEISFETRCDMEVVPFLYKKYGKNFLHKINGYFSMILIDSKNDKYYVISDRYGVKPAYYTVNNDVLYFSSELKGLEKMLKLDYDYNNIALAVSTVDFCYPLSSYKNVYRLPPGHILEYNEGKIKLSAWYTPIIKKSINQDNNIKEKFLNYFNDAVSIRMQTDVPVGCYLTGGLDSTSIAVTATKYNNNKPLHVFNAFIADKVKLEHGGDHDNYNSRKLAEEHGMKFHQIRIDKNFYLNNIVDIVNMHDELFLDTGTMIYYGVCKEAKKYVKVLLDGVAGDELLGGYPWQRHLRMIPYPMLKLLNKIIPYNRSLYLSLDRYSRAISQLYKLVSNYALFHIQGLQMIGNKSFGNDPHFNEEILSKINKSNFSTAINAIPNDFKNAINYCNFFSFVCHQNNNSDRSSMRYSIEGRSPYLDYRLVELCLGIDSKIKNKKGHKSLQREIFKDLLPDYIINAPKSGPSLPIKYWYHSDKGLRLKTDEYIEKNLNILEIILGKHIIQTFKENPNQLINRNLFLHHIFLVLIIWGKKNIEKKIINSDLPLYDFMDSY